MAENGGLVQLFGGALGASALTYILQTVKDRKRAKDARPSEVDANILTVARARDQLEADNVLLRQTLTEERRAHADDRAAWQTERAQMREEIEALEAQLRAERAAADQRYESLLQQLAEIRNRHGI